MNKRLTGALWLSFNNLPYENVEFFRKPPVDLFLQVFPVETGDSGSDSDSMARLLHLASGHFPAHLLHVPPGVQLRPHLQQHVAACTPHLLLLRLRRPQSVQPRWGATGPEQLSEASGMLTVITLSHSGAAGSAISYSAYIFPDKWVNGWFHQWFVTLAVLNMVICTSMSCYSR